MIFKNAEQEIDNWDIKIESLTLESKNDEDDIGKIERPKILKGQMEDVIISPVYYSFLQGKRPNKELLRTWNRKSKILLKQWN